MGVMIESLDTLHPPPKTSIRMIVMPNVKKESAAKRKFSAMRIRSAKKDQLSSLTASLVDN
jgi:predicted transcriptional regulator